MVRKWVLVAVAAMVVVGVAGCSSSNGSGASGNDSLPKLTRTAWTGPGLATAKATTDAIAANIPGQCADAAIGDFAAFPEAMQAVHSTVVPTAQMTCTVNDEVIEISVFANERDRNRFVDDRSTGLCTLAKAQAKKYKSRLTFPGLRWDVGAGNVTLQPDTESVARRLTTVTKGRFDPRGCAKGITVEWDTKAVNVMDALGRKVSAAGRGCDFVDLVPRESLDQTRKLSDAQLPAALGNCSFDTTQIALITYDRMTPQVKTFIDGRVRAACVADPALGRIDGDGFTVIASGTNAEQVHQVVGGTLAPSSCA